MANFKNRKFLLLLMLSAAVFFLRVFLPLNVWCIALISAFLALAFFAIGGGFARKAASIAFALFTLASVIAPFLYGTAVLARAQEAISFVSRGEAETVAVVQEVRFRTAYSSSYIIKVREIGGETADIRAILELERSSFFEYGDIITFSAALEETREEEAFLRAEKIFVRAVADDAVRIGEEKTGILHRISVVNQNMAERMVNLMGRDAGGFCAAIILGNKSYVDSEIKLNFSRAGISHLLALSGLHLSVLAGALDMILRGFTKKKTRGIILIISCFAFAIFTGLSASVLRASVMLAFVFAADIFGEENDSLTALFAAVWVILIFSGSAVYDVGFQLSAAATLGIIIVRPACDALFAKWKRPRKNKLLGAIRAVVKYFYGIFTMSAAAIIFTLPIIGYTFGEISLAGLWANFLFLPLASVLIVICTLLVPISYVPVLDAALAWVCKLTSEAMISLAASVSDIRGISLSLRYPFVPYLLAVLALALVVCIFIKRLSLLKIGSGVLALVLSFAICFGAYSGITSGDMTVRIGSDRSGEYVAFAADGESYIVDVSTGGTEFVRDALESRKLFCETEIDNFIMTHYHDHHAGAIFRLCESVKIRRVILPVPETDGEEADLAYISETLSAKGIEMVLYTRGEAFENGEVKIAFAPMQKISRSEKPLVAFTLEYAEWSFSYIEGAALESSFDYSEHLSSQTVFVGAHGAARKFAASAEAFSGASRVIFAEGAMEYFRGTEYLAEAYDIGAYGGEMTILYDN